MNSIDYNPDLDQIALSVKGNSEAWIIDHGTTTAQAAGHTGGRRGQGGDLLYRWGNPLTYRAGTANDARCSSSPCSGICRPLDGPESTWRGSCAA
jgi:hypothetical protein